MAWKGPRASHSITGAGGSHPGVGGTHWIVVKRGLQEATRGRRGAGGGGQRVGESGECKEEGWSGGARGHRAGPRLQGVGAASL